MGVAASLVVMETGVLVGMRLDDWTVDEAVNIIVVDGVIALLGITLEIVDGMTTDGEVVVDGRG